jgi:hypothetical protein
MIIIKVQGGLGNQLLQYSIGQVIALHYNKEVAYDITHFESETRYTKRPYLLDFFDTHMRIATQEEIQNVRYPFGKISKIFEKVARACNKFIFKKYYIGYKEDFFPRVAKSDSLYLEGYWQSYQYFDGYLEKLSKDISLKDGMQLEKVKESLLFGNYTSVAVHVRRSDFLKVGGGVQVLGRDYYKMAVKELEKFVPDPTYCIFSDDIVWVKEHLGDLFSKAVFPSEFKCTDYEEFALMKECDHAIIANSTFSFFSTLLTNSETKVVICPDDWLNIYLKDKEIPVCPKLWKRV